MWKALQRNNKMFLTKEYIAKWFLILLLFFQCCLSEEPPGGIMGELNISEELESVTNTLPDLHINEYLQEETATESFPQSELQTLALEPELETISSDIADTSSEYEPTHSPINNEEPLTTDHEMELVNKDTSNKFFRRLGLPADDVSFGAKIPTPSPSSSVKKDHPLNIEDFSLKELDAWRPVWPYARPFTNVNGQFTTAIPLRTRSSVNLVEVSPIYSIAKEPVTAYYFDLATPANSPAPGPLYDPTQLGSSFNPDSLSEFSSLAQATKSLVKDLDYAKPTSIRTFAYEANLKPSSVSGFSNRVSETISISGTASSNSTLVTEIPIYSIGNPSDFPFKNLTEIHSDDSSKDSDIVGSSSSLQTSTTDPSNGDSLNLSSTRTLFPSPSKVNIVSTDSSLDLPQFGIASTTIESTNKSKLNSRVPLWMRLSNKISQTIEVSPMSTIFVHNTVNPTPVFSLSNENDIPLGILSAGLPVLPELSSPRLVVTESLVSVYSLTATPIFSIPSSSERSITTTNTMKVIEDKTSLPSNVFKVPLDGEGHQSQNSVANINSIPEPKIKNIHNPMILIPHKVSAVSTTSSLESWKPLINDSVDSSATPLSPFSLVPKITTLNPSYHLQSSFTPITPTLSISSSEVGQMSKSKTILTVSQTPLFSAPSNSSLYIAKNGVQVPMLKETSLNSNIVASKTKKLYPNSTDKFSRPEAPFAEVEKDDMIDQFVAITEKEAALSTENTDNLPILNNVNDTESTLVEETTDFYLSTTTKKISIETETPTTTPTDIESDKGSSTQQSPTTTTTSTTTTSTTTTSTTTTSATSTTTTATPVPTEQSGNEEVFLEMTTSKSEESLDDERKIITVFEKPTGAEAKLQVVEMHGNGTNSTKHVPYVKAAVSYDLVEFCHHRKNIRNLLAEWVQKHMQSESMTGSYEVEIFYQPNCENINSDENIVHSKTNQTNLYFYIKKDGEFSPNSTLGYPKDLSTYEISRELEYLREKITHLELVNAISKEDRILEEAAAVGTSLIIIIIVTIILVFGITAAIFAVIVVRRRRSAETMHGRRCTPAANDAYSMDSVSVYYHSFKRKSKKRGSNKSLKSYLNQGFDDPNGPSRPLNFAKLTHFISDNEGIHKEYDNIPSILPNYDEMPRGCEDKNRYANVIPVPETRVLLKANKNTPCAEYINANTVHGPRGEQRYYIATQAPLDEIVCDFWQMVWEQETRVIVMLTDFVEKGIDKCADYLPPSETLDCHRVYGDFQITLKSRDMRDKYIASQVQLKNLENNLVREICHMWYTGWPQSGVPNEESPFISFIFDIRMARKRLRTKGPIVVHCSPGTGRTGTYIACDIAMRHFDDQNTVDIPKTVYKIRRERAGAVQTKEQYAFIYRVVNLYAAKLTTGNLDSF